MKVGILGAGAIGCAVGGRLALGGAEVVLVGRAAVGERVRAGLTLSRWGEPAVDVPAGRLGFATEAEAVHGCDVVLVTTKSRDTRAAARSLGGLPAGVPVGSLQNGVHNPEVLAEELPGRTVWPGVVSFNVVWADDGRRLHQGTS